MLPIHENSCKCHVLHETAMDHWSAMGNGENFNLPYGPSSLAIHKYGCVHPFEKAY